jgi:hypothetical protein
MPASTTNSSLEVTLTLSGEERSLLVIFLEQRLRDKQVEEHRTENFKFRNLVQHEEVVIQGLLDKLRRP